MQIKVAHLLQAIGSQFYTRSSPLLSYSTVAALFTNRLRKVNHGLKNWFCIDYESPAKGELQH